MVQIRFRSVTELLFHILLPEASVEIVEGIFYSTELQVGRSVATEQVRLVQGLTLAEKKSPKLLGLRDTVCVGKAKLLLTGTPLLDDFDSVPVWR